jgi:hypothetical protein
MQFAVLDLTGYERIPCPGEIHAVESMAMDERGAETSSKTPATCARYSSGHNRPVAKIIPLSRRRQWLPAAEIGHELVRLGPDSTGLAEELRVTLTDTTDDLRW